MLGWGGWGAVAQSALVSSGKQAAQRASCTLLHTAPPHRPASAVAPLPGPGTPGRAGLLPEETACEYLLVNDLRQF